MRMPPAPYKEARLESEICNISYARRLGCPVRARMLDGLYGFGTLQRDIRRAVKEVLSAFFDVVRMYAPERRIFCLWGIDLALAMRDGTIKAFLLEANPSPDVYFHDAEVDHGIDRMLVREMAPLLAVYLTKEWRAPAS